MLLQQLRIDALHNALVETDVSALRIHLILLARRMGLPSDNIMPIWDLSLSEPRAISYGGLRA